MSFKAIRPYQLVLLSALLVACVVIEIRFVVDFIALHGTAVRAHGQLSEIYTKPNGLVNAHFFYGPITLLLIYPLGFLSFATANGIWISLQCLAFVIFWVGLFKFYPTLWKKPFLWISVLAFAINPVHNNFQSNNMQLMILAALFVVEGLVQKEKETTDFWAGLLCALVSMIKIYPFFVGVYYCLTRGWAFRRGLMAGVGLFVLLPFLFFGKENGILLYRDFFLSLTRYHAENPLISKVEILCLPSLVARSFTPFLGAVTVQKLSVFLSLFVSGIFYLYVLNFRRKGMLNKEMKHRLWALSLAVMTLVNPSSLVHYIVFYVPAVCVLLKLIDESRELSRALIPYAAVSILFIAFTTEGIVGKALNNKLELWNIPTYGMLILCGTVAYGLFRYARKLGVPGHLEAV